VRQLSRKCERLDVPQQLGHSWPITGITLPFYCDKYIESVIKIVSFGHHIVACCLRAGISEAEQTLFLNIVPEAEQDQFR
jgi:hypothetical protein